MKAIQKKDRNGQSGQPSGPRIQQRHVSAWRKSVNKYNWLYLMIVPTLIWVIVFCYLPMGGVVIAFKRYNGLKSIWDSKWVGFKWFKSFFDSYYFGTTMRNTIVLSLYSLLTFPIPIIIALMLNEVRNQRAKGAMQTVMYAPHFVSTVVVVSMMNLFFTTNGGIVNVIIEAFGGEPIDFMTKPSAFPHMFEWSNVWQNTGWNCIIYVAALSGVDQSLHEAAILDGATRFQRIRHINIPTIMPTIMITLIMHVGSIMSVNTDKILLMMNDLNASTSQVIGTYVYERGLLSGDYSYAAAVGLFQNVINLVLLLLVNYISKKTTDSSLF